MSLGTPFIYLKQIKALKKRKFAKEVKKIEKEIVFGCFHANKKGYRGFFISPIALFVFLFLGEDAEEKSLRERNHSSLYFQTNPPAVF